MPAPSLRRPAAGFTALLGTAALLLSACNDGNTGDAGGDDSGHDDAEQVSLAHIHGLGINPADEQLYAASHHGVFLVTGQDEPEQVAGLTQDFMGFTIIGPDHFLGSGHPSPDDRDQPPNLGLIESTDAGQTWESVSLAGEVDFHAMDAKHGRVYGWDSQSAQFMVSEDKQNWERRAEIGMAGIAVSPDDPDELLATTQDGLQRSTDGGRSFTPIAGAPVLVFLHWPTTERLVGVAPDGTVHASDDGGASWTERGQVPGSPQAITTHGESEVYVATEQTIHHSTDDGETFSVFQPLE